MKKSTLERFEEKVELIPMTDCHFWVAYTDKAGYGHFRFEEKNELAHRVAYKLYKGGIPEGLFVLHTCDNPLCVSPHHLFLGTHQDNMDDMTQKSRQHKQKGVDNSNVKLTKDDVLKIRSMASIVSYVELARRYKVSYQQIFRIINRKNWSHI